MSMEVESMNIKLQSYDLKINDFIDFISFFVLDYDKIINDVNINFNDILVHDNLLNNSYNELII